jgi:hypothetical protein
MPTMLLQHLLLPLLLSSKAGLCTALRTLLSSRQSYRLVGCPWLAMRLGCSSLGNMSRCSTLDPCCMLLLSFAWLRPNHRLWLSWKARRRP